VAAICRHTVWIHPPEPNDFKNEGLWCQPLCERRPNLRFCKQPIHIRREVPGHVANRLQAALWREALHLVAEGIASVADVDTAISAGPGLRWALMGPYLTFHLAGGVGGIDHFLDQFAARTNMVSSSG